jgi:hypothetical protein
MGSLLEHCCGSKNLAILIPIISVLCSVIYVTLAFTLAEVMHNLYYARACVIGFSGNQVPFLQVNSKGFWQRCISLRIAAFCTLSIIQYSRKQENSILQKLDLSLSLGEGPVIEVSSFSGKEQSWCMLHYIKASIFPHCLPGNHRSNENDSNSGNLSLPGTPSTESADGSRGQSRNWQSGLQQLMEPRSEGFGHGKRTHPADGDL